MMKHWFRKKKVRSALPWWMENYLTLDFSIDPSQTIDQTSFIVLDCETTGLKKSARIVSIGAIECTHRDIRLGTLLDLHFPVSGMGRSAEIHGELSSHHPGDNTSRLEALIRFLGHHIIVGHHIGFDISRINRLFNEKFGVTLQNKLLDTAHLMKRLDPVKAERVIGGEANLSLDELCEQFHIKIENRHTALGDAYLTAQLFQRLLSRLKHRGVGKVGDLVRN